MTGSYDDLAHELVEGVAPSDYVASSRVEAVLKCSSNLQFSWHAANLTDEGRRRGIPGTRL